VGSVDSFRSIGSDTQQLDPTSFDMSKLLPSLIVLANRGHLVAYKSSEDDVLTRIREESFSEGTEKLSDIVTDQAGAFPVGGTVGTALAERLPLLAEIEMRCFRQIADIISELYVAHSPPTWGFAALSEINSAILEQVEPRIREKVSINLRRNLVGLGVKEVAARFMKNATED
jgi:hypothetical protein